MTRNRLKSRKERQVRVVAIRRKVPDLKTLARVLIVMAEEDLQAEKQKLNEI